MRKRRVACLDPFIGAKKSLFGLAINKSDGFRASSSQRKKKETSAYLLGYFFPSRTVVFVFLFP